MNFEEYRRQSAATAVYPGTPGSWISLSYVALGMVGEFGEVADQIKKVVRDDGGRLTPDRRARLVSELGDGFWYLARLLDELGIDHEEVFDYNAAKLTARKAAGTLAGDGEGVHRKPFAYPTDQGTDYDWKPGPGPGVFPIGGLVAATRAAADAERQAAALQMLEEAANAPAKPEDGYYRVTITSVTLGRWRNRELTRGFWATSKEEASRIAVAKFGGQVKETVGPIDLTANAVEDEGDRS